MSESDDDRHGVVYECDTSAGASRCDLCICICGVDEGRDIGANGRRGVCKLTLY